MCNKCVRKERKLNATHHSDFVSGATMCLTERFYFFALFCNKNLDQTEFNVGWNRPE